MTTVIEELPYLWDIVGADSYEILRSNLHSRALNGVEMRISMYNTCVLNIQYALDTPIKDDGVYTIEVALTNLHRLYNYVEGVQDTGASRGNNHPVNNALSEVLCVVQERIDQVFRL